MQMRALLPLLLLLAGCGPADRHAPIAVYALEGRPPVGGELGDRILIDGRVIRTSSGFYLLEHIAGSGRLATRNCLLLRGVQGGLGVPHLRLWWFAGTGERVILTGTINEVLPHYPIDGGGQHTHGTCTAALDLDGVRMR